MLAYQKWKEKCVHHLEGDWAFAIYIRTENKFQLLRDCIGHSTIFYSVFENSFIFSTSINLIISKIGTKNQIDLNQLKLLSLNYCELSEGKTLFKKIFILKNACMLCVGLDLFLSEKRYWYLRKVPRLNYLHEDDVLADFMGVYSSSIISRIRSAEDTALFLSSGLDSTSIAYFASMYFKLYSRKLITYTSYPQYINEIPENKVDKAREEIRVRKFVEKNESVESFCLNFENYSISKQFHSTDLDNFDPVIIGNTFWINGIMESAKQKGCKIILSGQLGNASLTWSAPYLTFSKLSKFRLKDLIKRILVLSKKFNISILSVVWHEIITPLKFFFRSKLYFRRFKESTLNSSVFNVSSFRKGFNLKEEVLKYVPGFTFFLTDENFRYAFLSKLSSKSGSKWYTLGQNYGIETTDPTSDKRLIEFTFRISEDYFNYFGDSKYIFKKMMNGRLPDYILHNKVSAVQAYDIGLRIVNDINFSELVKYFATEKTYVQGLDYSLIPSQYADLLKSNNLAHKFRISNNILKNLSILNFIKKNT
jgi:asparagine synthase (glutamine-hydrolysing)